MPRALPPSLVEHLADLLRRARRRYRKRLAHCQAHFSETAVHDLRVETRRTLALLDLLRTLGVGDSVKKSRKVFKRRLDAFDELRDAQVQWLWLAPRLKQFPEARELAKLLRKRECHLIARLRRTIRGQKQVRIANRLKALARDVAHAATPPRRTADAAAALQRPLEAAFRRVTTLRQRLRADEPQTIHQLRLAFKKYRYLCELLQPLLPGVTSRTRRQMQRWQAAMGDIQDLVVFREALARAVEDEEVKSEAVARLERWLARQQQRRIDRFLQRAAELDQFAPEALRARAAARRKATPRPPAGEVVVTPSPPESQSYSSTDTSSATPS